MGSTEIRSTDEALPSVLVGFRDGITVLDLVGEHDLTTAEEVGFKIREQAARGCGIVVSLAETEFVDSSLVRVLFMGDHEMLQYGRRLVLYIGHNEPVRRVLVLAGMGEQLLCCDSLDEAIEFASQRSP
jgi:anti-anti-sigma factor